MQRHSPGGDVGPLRAVVDGGLAVAALGEEIQGGRLDRGPIGVAAHALPAAALTDATRGALQSVSTQAELGPLALLAAWAVAALGAAAVTFRAE